MPAGSPPAVLLVMIRSRRVTETGVTSQYLYFCTSKASNIVPAKQVMLVMMRRRRVNSQHLYFCTSKQVKLRKMCFTRRRRVTGDESKVSKSTFVLVTQVKLSA